MTTIKLVENEEDAFHRLERKFMYPIFEIFAYLKTSGDSESALNRLKVLQELGALADRRLNGFISNCVISVECVKHADGAHEATAEGFDFSDVEGKDNRRRHRNGAPRVDDLNLRAGKAHEIQKIVAAKVIRSIAKVEELHPLSEFSKSLISCLQETLTQHVKFKLHLRQISSKKVTNIPLSNLCEEFEMIYKTITGKIPPSIDDNVNFDDVMETKDKKMARRPSEYTSISLSNDDNLQVSSKRGRVAVGARELFSLIKSMDTGVQHFEHSVLTRSASELLDYSSSTISPAEEAATTTVEEGSLKTNSSNERVAISSQLWKTLDGSKYQKIVVGTIESLANKSRSKKGMNFTVGWETSSCANSLLSAEQVANAEALYCSLYGWIGEHKLIGECVAKYFRDEKTGEDVMFTGTVYKYSNSTPTLFRVIWSDGDIEDFDAKEVKAAINLFKQAADTKREVTKLGVRVAKLINISSAAFKKEKTSPEVTLYTNDNMSSIADVPSSEFFNVDRERVNDVEFQDMVKHTAVAKIVHVCRVDDPHNPIAAMVLGKVVAKSNDGKFILVLWDDCHERSVLTKEDAATAKALGSKIIQS